MFVEQKFNIGLSDINHLKELNNTALLRYLEDIAGTHSEMAGYGITDIEQTRKSWILLSWKVKVINRPLINDNLNVITWSRCIDKIYAYRDFKVENQYGEVVCIATSKWVLIDIDKGRIAKLTEEIAEKYKQEPDSNVFGEHDLEKLIEPEEEISQIDYKANRSMLDVNKHLHNIYYLDIAKEALPEEIAFGNELNEFEVMYKKEIKIGDTVKAIYSKKDDYHYVTIKDYNKEIIHAVIRLK